MTKIDGYADEGFGAVADAFAANFDDPGEIGAGFCLYVDGIERVHLWGGLANRRDEVPWTEDTLTVVFSTTKGIAALAVAQLVQSGAVSYDDPVADHWPEFGANGKDTITIGDLVSHQAGLATIDASLTVDEVLAGAPVVELLAGQAPSTRALAYHAITFGWLVGELVTRVDGRCIGDYVRDEIAAPVGAEFWIGLPDELEGRVARLIASPPTLDPAVRDQMRRLYTPGSLSARALTLNGRLPSFNSRRMHAAEMAGANGITNARSLARIYAATVGSVDGVRLLDHDTMQLARTERVHDDDLTLLVKARFGAGFWLHNEITPMIQDGSFGHSGAGGSLGFANPELGIGYGYVMNKMGPTPSVDERTASLNAAVLASL